MKILAIDTSMAACSAAIFDSAHELALAGNFVPMERGHAEAIAPMVRQVMDEAGLGFADLDRIGVTVGPGTFTGVRIGLALANGLALARRIPVIGLDSLSAIAANAWGAEGPLLVAAEARKNDVYAALFEDGRMVRPPAVVPLTALEIPHGAQVLGTAAAAVVAAYKAAELIRSQAGELPDARNFARLAAAAAPPSLPPNPLYLRPPDARPQTERALRPSSIAIQTASAAEASVLAHLHAECFDNPWTEEDFASLMSTPGTLALLAVQAGEPVAFLLVRKAADEIEILTLGTRPFARRRGIARRLIKHVANSWGPASMFIEVASSNAAARALYAAHDFREAGRRRNYYEGKGGVREDAIIMRREPAP